MAEDEADVSDLFTKYEWLIQKETNPVLKQIEISQIAVLDLTCELHEIRKDRGSLEDVDRALAIYNAKIDVIIAALEAIPLDVWEEWCEMPKSELIPAYTKVLRAMYKLGPIEH